MQFLQRGLGALQGRRRVVERLAHLVRQDVQHLAALLQQPIQLRRVAFALESQFLFAQQCDAMAPVLRDVLECAQEPHRHPAFALDLPEDPHPEVPALRGDEGQLHVPRRAVAQGARDRLVQARPGIGRIEVAATRGRRLEIVVDLVDASRLRGPVDDVGAQVDLPAAHAGDAPGAIEDLLAGAQPLLVGLAVGDVLDGTDEPDGASRVVADGAGPGPQDAHGAVLAPDAEFERQLLLVDRHLAPGRDDPVAVEFVQRLHPAVAQTLAGGQSVHLAPARVGVGALAVHVGVEDAQRRRLRQGAEPGLAVAQRVLGRPQGRDVRDLHREAPHDAVLVVGDVADLQVQRRAVRAGPDILERLAPPRQRLPHVGLAPREALGAEDALHRQAHDPRGIDVDLARVRQIGEAAGEPRVEVGQHRRHLVDEAARQRQRFICPGIGHARHLRGMDGPILAPSATLALGRRASCPALIWRKHPSLRPSNNHDP